MPKKHNITYYMGAGASANGIPIVSQFRYSPHHLINFLENLPPNLIDEFPDISVTIRLLKEYKHDFELVLSMDTLAKRYYDIDSNSIKYHNYKKFLEALICFQHYYKQDFSNKDATDCRKNLGDNRYENLFKTIGEKNPNPEDTFVRIVIPNNFHFITWNYDVLFEMAASQDLYSTGNYRFLIEVLNEDSTYEAGYNGAKLLKLNGTAIHADALTRYSALHHEFHFNNDEFYNTLLIEWLLSKSSGYGLENEPQKISGNDGINFAWENKKNEQLKEKLKARAKITDIVVLIGYSFPTINRLIDKSFFDNLIRVKKIYVQGRNYDDSVKIQRIMKQSLRAELKKKLIPVEAGDFFFVPSEYFDEQIDEGDNSNSDVNESIS